MNLIPQIPGTTPSYWCTWDAQHPYWRVTSDEAWHSFDMYAAMESGTAPRQAMNQHNLLGPSGWVQQMFPRIRSDLYLAVDDGWDVPYDTRSATNGWAFGSLIPDAARFPELVGTPAQRLKQLNERIKAFGWRGTALWVAAQVVGDGKAGTQATARATEAYWRERACWSAEAGIAYWKVDWGKRADSAAFRAMLTEVACQEAPGLLVEHVRCLPPFNYTSQGSTRFVNFQPQFAEALTMLRFSDVLRSYDYYEPLGVPTTLDRVAALLEHGVIDSQAQGLLNCEDQLYLGAALGCALGIMRVPVRVPYTHWQWPRIDEAVRAVRWQRIAPAFGVSSTSVAVDPVVLSDTALIPTSHWYQAVQGLTISQQAPARVSRGMPLPTVDGASDLPYVVASQHPNGAVAVATLPRATAHTERTTPLAHVGVQIHDLAAPIGIFGQYRTLTLRLAQPRSGRRIWAQDLAADEAVDITDLVGDDEQTVLLPGELLHRLGTHAQTPDDPSEPGLVLAFTE